MEKINPQFTIKSSSETSNDIMLNKFQSVTTSMFPSIVIIFISFYGQQKLNHMGASLQKMATGDGAVINVTHQACRIINYLSKVFQFRLSLHSYLQAAVCLKHLVTFKPRKFIF